MKIIRWSNKIACSEDMEIAAVSKVPEDKPPTCGVSSASFLVTKRLLGNPKSSPSCSVAKQRFATRGGGVEYPRLTLRQSLHSRNL